MPETLTLHALLDEVVAQHGSRPAVSLDQQTFSFEELAGRSRAMAGALRAAGVGSGDRVGVLARNTPDYYSLLFACSRIGAVLVGLNWRLSRRELEVIVTDAAPRVVVVNDEFRPTVEAVAATVDARLASTETDVTAWAAHEPAAAAADVQDAEATVAQLYTSGTTGAPKGILITHANLGPSPVSGRRLYGMSETSVNLLVSPLFHIGGLGYSLTCLSLGGHTVLVSSAAAGDVLDEVERRGVTHSFMVPSVIQTLVDAPDVAQRDLGSLEVLAYGAAPMGPALVDRARQALGCDFRAVYGMTETAGTVVAAYPGWGEGIDEERLLASIGKPLPWMGEARVVDLVTGEECAPHQVGEIEVHSVQVTPGYWNRPQATEKLVRPGGWLRTGDAAYVDEDGLFFLQDRIKDMIISGGENVFPAEVEAVIAELDVVAECAVIGVPSERWGETVKAVVVPRPGAPLDGADVIAYCRDNLAHYKCPTSVEVVRELPHNASGKILKRELRAQFAAPVGSR